MSFRASILTLYPEMFPGNLGMSMSGRALERGDWSLTAKNIRDYASDKHRSLMIRRLAVVQAWCCGLIFLVKRLMM